MVYYRNRELERLIYDFCLETAHCAQLMLLLLSQAFVLTATVFIFDLIAGYD